MSVCNFFNIITARTAWGAVTTDGSLGYPCELSDGRLMAPPEHTFDALISAHADSEVILELSESASICGFLAGSTDPDPLNPTLFSIDFNTLGILYGPWETTTALTLPPGRYRLRCDCRAKPDWRHSVWGLTRKPDFSPSPLAVVTVGRYPSSELPWKMMRFTRTLTRNGLLARVCGAGENFRNHYLDKIADVMDSIENLPEHVSHVLFSDGSDSFVMGTERELQDAFLELESDFIISMERACWPARDAEWEQAFPEYPDHRRWPNSGGWMGTREGVIRVLEECIRIAGDIRADRWHGPMERWRRLASFVNDDQWLMQLAYLYGNAPMKGDQEFRLFTNFGTGRHVLTDQNMDYEVVDGRIRSKPSDTYPLVIHFSGEARWKCQGQWQAKVGLL